MFTKDGTFEVTIKDALAATSQFSPNDENAFDICLLVETGDGQSDWWRGEISGKYGRGNFSHMTQTEITMQTLIKIGWGHGGDLSKLKTLVGKKTVATVKATEKVGDDGVTRTFYNVQYLGGSNRTPEAIDPAEAQRRLLAIMDNGGGNNRPTANTGASQRAQQSNNTNTPYDPFAQR